MFEISYSQAQSFSASNRLIVSAAHERGWKVFAYDLPASHMYIDRGDSKKIHIYSSCPPSVSYADAIVSNDKWLTYKALMAEGVAQPETIVIEDNTTQEVKQAFLKEHGKVVIKPRDAAHGNGVTVGVETIAQLEEAVSHALKKNISAGTSIAQKQFEGGNTDLRLLCIQGSFVAAIHRVPARVYGDGKNTVIELIRLENSSPDRGQPYKAKFARIDEDRASTFLGDKLHRVPQVDEEVAVLGIANYGAGGETIDVTDKIPQWMKTEVEKASRSLGLSVAGVDYIATDQKDITELEPNSKDAVLIEVNKSPSLCIHDEPTSGVNRHTVDLYLDHLSRL